MHPKIIYFCNKTISERDKMAAYNWKKLNPDYEIELYDDEMIKSFLLNEYGQLYKDVFDYLQDGPIKADFWRLCILYKRGGVYSDIDNVPLVKISDFIENDVDFLTCSSYCKYNFNPNFIISNKNNIILKRCIHWYINKYSKKDRYKYWDWTIMKPFTEILHLKDYNRKKWGIYELDNMKIQIIKESYGTHHSDAHILYNNVRLFNCRSPDWDFKLHKFKDVN